MIMVTHLELMFHPVTPIYFSFKKRHVFLPALSSGIHKSLSQSIEHQYHEQERLWRYHRGWIISIRGMDFALCDVLRQAVIYGRNLCIDIARYSFSVEDVRSFEEDICNGLMDMSLHSVALHSLRDNMPLFRGICHEIFKTVPSSCLIKRLETC